MGPTQTSFFIAGVFLVVGCFPDLIPAIIIVGTILHRLAKAVAMDPVYFVTIGIVLKDTFIMLIPMLGVLVVVIVWPDLVLFMPKMVSPDFLK